jgi:hypothetical protein
VELYCTGTGTVLCQNKGDQGEGPNAKHATVRYGTGSTVIVGFLSIRTQAD